ncbi:MAG: lipopolysaccharide biosynthesis protein [Actinomycetota bacterium]|nr:lipopolysaccharide biosynthesis protein [Actinomycetota bacterium]
MGADNSRVAANTVLSLIAILALGVTRLLFSLLVSHRLGAAVLGRVNTQLSVATFASLAFATGTSVAATKFVPAALGRGDEAQARRALLLLLRWCVLGTVLTTVATALILPWLRPPFTTHEIVATCALVVAYSAYTFVRGAQYGYGKVRRYAAIEVLCDAVAVTGALLVVLLHADLLLLLPFIAGYTLFAVLGWIGLPRPRASVAPDLPVALRREMRSYGVWAAVGIMTSTGFLQLSMVFAYHYGSKHEVGFYAAALVLTVPAYFVPRALSMALFPSMAHAFGRGDTDEIRRQVDAGTRILMVASLPFFAAAILLARPVLTIVFHPSYAQAHLVLELLLAATYVAIVSIPAVNSLSATQHALVRVPAFAALAGTTVGVVCWLLLGPAHGITGIAIGYLAGTFVGSGTNMYVAWRRWQQSWTTLLLRVGLSAAAACLLWAFVDAVGARLLLRLGAIALVTVVTAALCPYETRQVVSRLRLVLRQARSR